MKGKRKRKSTNVERLLRIAAVVFLISVICYTLVLQYDRVLKKKMLEEKCNEIERSPDLLFDCDCFPTPERKKNTSDYVENRTEAFCTCVCDLGNNQTYTIEVRVAK